MNVRIHPTRRNNLVLASNNISTTTDDHTVRDTVHNIRIAGFANTHDQTLLDTNVGLVYARVIDDERVRDDEIETVVVEAPAHLPHAFAQRLAAAELALVTIRRHVPLYFDPEVRRAQSHAITCRGAKHGAIRRPVHGGRLGFSETQAGCRLRRMREPGLLQVRDDGFDAVEINMPRGEVVSATNHAMTANLDERDGLGVAGLESHRRAGRDVEAAAVRQLTVERELRVRLDEVVMASHLDRSVPCARDLDPDASPPFVEGNAALDHHHGPGGVLGVVYRRRRPREQIGRRHGQEAAVERLGEVPVLRGDRVVHGDQICACRERALDLDLVQRAHDRRQHVAAA